MKISIGMKLQTGPWGGGNRFVSSLVNHLDTLGWQVSFDLKDPELDLILLTDPRLKLASCSYNHSGILHYLLHINPRALVVHRVNECDERKGTTGLNDLLASATRVADHTVFVSSWLQNLHLGQGMPVKSSSVILNGGNQSIFHPRGYVRWDGHTRLRLVTHHWGAIRMKGFDVYEQLDQMLAQPTCRDRFGFTYIGRLPDDFTFTHAHHIDPLDGQALGDEIRGHHVYLTASRNEPGSNHNIEGALCGLPLLYVPQASMPETSDTWGIPFTPDQFPEKLEEMYASYPRWADRMPDYPFTATRTCSAYVELFNDMIRNRAQILKRRRLFRHPWWLARTWWQGSLEK